MYPPTPVNANTVLQPAPTVLVLQADHMLRKTQTTGAYCLYRTATAWHTAARPPFQIRGLVSTCSSLLIDIKSIYIIIDRLQVLSGPLDVYWVCRHNFCGWPPAELPTQTSMVTRCSDIILVSVIHIGAVFFWNTRCMPPVCLTQATRVLHCPIQWFTMIVMHWPIVMHNSC